VEPHQRASIYRHGDAYYVTSEDRTVDGVYVIGGAGRVATSVEDADLGEAILSAVDASRHGVPTPGCDENVAGPLLSLAGSKTWRAFSSLVRSARANSERQPGVRTHRVADIDLRVHDRIVAPCRRRNHGDP
jgi:hypothetical protein